MRRPSGSGASCEVGLWFGLLVCEEAIAIQTNPKTTSCATLIDHIGGLLIGPRGLRRQPVAFPPSLFERDGERFDSCPHCRAQVSFRSHCFSRRLEPVGGNLMEAISRNSRGMLITHDYPDGNYEVG